MSEPTTKYRKRFACPHCGRTLIAVLPRGGDGSVWQYPIHYTTIGDQEYKCFGSLRVCEPKQQRRRNVLEE